MPGDGSGTNPESEGGNDRDKLGRFKPGNSRRWKPGDVPNPNGGRSLKQELRKVLLEVLKSTDGKVEMSRMEVLARKVCTWASEDAPVKHYTARQNVAMKALLDLFAPAENLHRHEINASVGVGLTPAARTFQEQCAKLAEGNGEYTASDLRRLRDRIHVSDEDLGVENGNGQGEGRE